MGNTTKRCEAPTNEIDHDARPIFGTVAYLACGKPAAWLVEGRRGEWHACESCATDALLYGKGPVSDENGDSVVLNDDQEIVVAA